MSTAAPHASTAPDETTHGLTAQEVETLSKSCLEAREKAYCPYSLFRVGCALLTTTGPIITGANVENAAYPVGTCAERVAMGTAVIAGHRSFKAVAVATDLDDQFCSPCGMCRQFLREFLQLDTPIFMHTRDGRFQVKTMGELLPDSFGPDVLPPKEELARRNGKAS
ncbi:cytidine deaminase [Saccharata proteae CBS 121410]|uniref:Cytidine deaminase n=1 Tax=Saccharata proteae CBS 121410 TaxID=1314787 RepID=A0A9P4HXB9_9PEZI|nr:cytidine deaminase [Saccharata proteae CBS 121410]